MGLGLSWLTSPPPPTFETSTRRARGRVRTAWVKKGCLPPGRFHRPFYTWNLQHGRLSPFV